MADLPRVKGANSDYKYVGTSDPEKSPIIKLPEGKAPHGWAKVFICPAAQPSAVEPHKDDKHCHGTDAKCSAPEAQRKGHAMLYLHEKEGAALVADKNTRIVADQEGAVQLLPATKAMIKIPDGPTVTVDAKTVHLTLPNGPTVSVNPEGINLTTPPPPKNGEKKDDEKKEGETEKKTVASEQKKPEATQKLAPKKETPAEKAKRLDLEKIKELEEQVQTQEAESKKQAAVGPAVTLNNKGIRLFLPGHMAPEKKKKDDEKKEVAKKDDIKPAAKALTKEQEKIKILEKKLEEQKKAAKSVGDRELVVTLGAEGICLQGDVVITGDLEYGGTMKKSAPKKQAATSNQ